VNCGVEPVVTVELVFGLPAAEVVVVEAELDVIAGAAEAEPEADVVAAATEERPVTP